MSLSSGRDFIKERAANGESVVNPSVVHRTMDALHLNANIGGFSVLTVNLLDSGK